MSCDNSRQATYFTYSPDYVLSRSYSYLFVYVSDSAFCECFRYLLMSSIATLIFTSNNIHHAFILFNLPPCHLGTVYEKLALYLLKHSYLPWYILFTLTVLRLFYTFMHKIH